jgi:hypothetical protein
MNGSRTRRFGYRMPRADCEPDNSVHRISSLEKRCWLDVLATALLGLVRTSRSLEFERWKDLQDFAHCPDSSSQESLADRLGEISAQESAVRTTCILLSQSHKEG